MRAGYVDQVQLLVRVLPFVGGEEVFALKGGTAINLFHRDLPRLSVDIDLNFLPVKERTESLVEIDEALDRIAAHVRDAISNVQVRRIPGGSGGDTRLHVRRSTTEVKLEVSPVLRGVVHPPRLMRVADRVEEEFGFAESMVVSFEDLFAGKLVAALDRQHPRDLFDVKLLLEHEGISDALFRTFLVYVASSSRPIHELLDPRFKELRQSYERDFEGMTDIRVNAQALQSTASQLVSELRARLDENSEAFLLGLHDGEPDFSLIGLPDAAELPAVRWKLLNLQRFRSEDPQKHGEQRNALTDLFA